MSFFATLPLIKAAGIASLLGSLWLNASAGNASAESGMYYAAGEEAGIKNSIFTVHEPASGHPDSTNGTDQVSRMEIIGPDGLLEQALVLTARDIDAPLGAGTYIVTRNPDGTFNERFYPAKGSSQPAFEAGNLPAYWQNDSRHQKDGFRSRLQARLIEGQIENALILQGYNPEQVRKDVVVLESGINALRGTFASFAPGAAEKYVMGWSREKTILGLGSAWISHKSTGTRTGPPIPGTGFAPKLYNGALGSGDSYPVHLGLVRADRKEHKREAWKQLKAYLRVAPPVNVARENARSVRIQTSRSPVAEPDNLQAKMAQ